MSAIRSKSLIGLLVLGLGLLCAADAAARIVELDEVNYHLALPRNYDPQKTYHLVVAVHGLRWSGQMAEIEARHFQRRGHDVIAVGPNMNWGNGRGHEKAQNTDAAFSAMMRHVRENHKVHDKYLLIGYSRGVSLSKRYAVSRTDELLAVVHYGSSPPRQHPRSLPMGLAAGENDQYAKGLEPWGEQFNRGGGYAMIHVVPGLGHDINGSMRDMTVDLFEKCISGLAPRDYDQVVAKIEEAKTLEAAGRHREAAIACRMVLGVANLPERFATPMREAHERNWLVELGKRHPDVQKQWDEAPQQVQQLLSDFTTLPAYREQIATLRQPFRGSDLDAFFAQAELAGNVAMHVQQYMRDVTQAKERGTNPPPIRMLRTRIDSMLRRIDHPRMQPAIEQLLAPLPGDDEPTVPAA